MSNEMLSQEEINALLNEEAVELTFGKGCVG